MSKIGLQPIKLDSKFSCDFDSASNMVVLKGANLLEEYRLPDGITCTIADGYLHLNVDDKLENPSRLLGLHRSILQNLIVGMSEPFTRILLLKGVGYKAEVKGKYLVLYLGYTHNIKYLIPDNIKITAPKPIEIHLESRDKHLLGVVASDLCNFRKYDPYKGKGLFFKDREMLRKDSSKK